MSRHRNDLLYSCCRPWSFGQPERIFERVHLAFEVRLVYGVSRLVADRLLLGSLS